MSDSEPVNFYRLITLIVKTGTRTLLKVFLKYIPNNVSLDQFLKTKSSKTIIKKLNEKRILTEPQFQLLNAYTLDAKKFDISLLVILLRNFTGVATGGWDKAMVPSSDRSIVGFIIRIRNVRNDIVGHSSDVKVTYNQFMRHWAEVEIGLKGLAGHISESFAEEITKEISSTYTMPFPATPNSDLEDILRKWHVEDLYTELASLKDTVEQQACDMKKALEGIASINDKLQTGAGVQAPTAPPSNQNGSPIQQIANVISVQINQTFQAMDQVYDKVSTQTTTEEPQMMAIEDNPNMLSKREIEEYSRKLGVDWSTFAMYLGYCDAQTEQIREVYRNEPMTLRRKLIKEWQTAVTRCKDENPRMLLAAAFCGINDVRTANKVLKGDKNKLKEAETLRPKPETEAEVERITFDIVPTPNIINNFLLGNPMDFDWQRLGIEYLQPGPGTPGQLAIGNQGHQSS